MTNFNPANTVGNINVKKKKNSYNNKIFRCSVCNVYCIVFSYSISLFDPKTVPITDTAGEMYIIFVKSNLEIALFSNAVRLFRKRNIYDTFFFKNIIRLHDPTSH